MKRLLTWMALVLSCGISAAAVVRIVQSEMRSPPAFQRADLEAWLTKAVTAVERESPTVRRRAAWMLEQDMTSGYDWTPFQQSLDTESKRRFEARWHQLLGVLFLQRARQFAALPTVHREGFLQTQLASMTTWYVLDDRGRRISGPSLLLKEGMKSSELHDGTAKRTLNAFRDALGKAAADIMLKRFLPAAKGATPGAKPTPRRDE